MKDCEQIKGFRMLSVVRAFLVSSRRVWKERSWRHIVFTKFFGVEMWLCSSCIGLYGTFERCVVRVCVCVFAYGSVWGVEC